MKKENPLESLFKKRVRKEIAEKYPGSHIIHLDPVYTQGISDMLILYKETWAMLEYKRSSTKSYRPNQEYYIQHFDEMSFDSVIFPENKKDVLKALERWFNFVTDMELKRNFQKRYGVM